VTLTSSHIDQVPVFNVLFSDIKTDHPKQWISINYHQILSFNFILTVLLIDMLWSLDILIIFLFLDDYVDLTL